MRLVGMVVSAVLGLAVIAEGAYIIRTRSQLRSVSDRLEALQAERDEGDVGAGVAPPRPWAGAPRGAAEPGAEPTARRLPPPRLQAAPAPAPPPRSDNPLPLPPALDGAEAREQLRAFVVAAMEREREESRTRQEQRFAEREQERRDRMAKELNLSPAEAEKFKQIFNDARATREGLRAKLQAGELQGDVARQQMQALRDDSQKQMQALLGPERMKQYEQLQGREQGRAGGGGRRGFGGGPWGGGPPGGFAGPAPGAGP
jgi:hypothetical protein